MLGCFLFISATLRLNVFLRNDIINYTVLSLVELLSCMLKVSLWWDCFHVCSHCIANIMGSPVTRGSVRQSFSPFFSLSVSFLRVGLLDFLSET